MNSNITAQLFGGHVLQAAIGGEPVFYVAPQNLYVAGQPRRGGVPVLFPQFNNDGDFPKHGFARVMDWQPLASGGSIQSWQACLHASAKEVEPYLRATKARWPHSAELTIRIELQDNRLLMTLSVKNTGATEFAFTGGLHPYFIWPEGDVEIEQLGIRLSRELMVRQGQGIEEKFLHRSDRLTVLTATGKMTIEKFGFEEWMLWNPGPQHSLADIYPEDWQAFYCLEPISSVRPHCLKPTEVFTGGFSLQIEPR